MAIHDFTSERDRLKKQSHIIKPFLTEQLDEDPFARYFGSKDSGNSMILFTHNVDKGAGETEVFTLQYFPKVNEVYGENTLYGKGNLGTSVNSIITYGKARYAVSAKDFDIAEFFTEFNATSQLNQDLSAKRTKFTIRRHINQFAWCFAHGSKQLHEGRDAASYDYELDYEAGEVTSKFEDYFKPKIKNCVINQVDAVGDGISSDRLLFGAESIRNVIAAAQTIQSRCEVGVPDANANIGTADYDEATSGYCTLDHINNLVQIAKRGGRKLGVEAPIKPMFYTNFEGHKANGYTYFISPRVKFRLLKNPIIKDLLIRPFRESGQPTYFNGTEYIGRIFGTDIVCVEQFEYLDFTTDTGVDIGYGALCGAGAYAKVNCGSPKFTTEKMDHENQWELGVTMIDGMKVVKFPSKRYQNVNTYPQLERGIIHSFTLI
jgi:hypothetical protein